MRQRRRRQEFPTGTKMKIRSVTVVFCSAFVTCSLLGAIGEARAVTAFSSSYHGANCWPDMKPSVLSTYGFNSHYDVVSNYAANGAELICPVVNDGKPHLNGANGDSVTLVINMYANANYKYEYAYACAVSRTAGTASCGSATTTLTGAGQVQLVPNLSGWASGGDLDGYMFILYMGAPGTNSINQLNSYYITGQTR